MALKSRRSFLLFAVGDAGFYGDPSRKTACKNEVKYPEQQQRQLALLPASVESRKAFLSKCVGCLKCLAACPRKVLTVSGTDGHQLRPSMDFRYGWCYPECSLCANSCPAGALGGVLSKTEKLNKRAGVAQLNRSICLRTDGVKCNACTRHCPVKALTFSKSGELLIDEVRCIGCGACEYHCPARPLTAIHVEGFK